MVIPILKLYYGKIRNRILHAVIGMEEMGLL